MVTNQSLDSMFYILARSIEVFCALNDGLVTTEEAQDVFFD